MNPFADTAKQYHDAGYSIVPILAKAKRPALTAWTKYCNMRASEPESLGWVKKYSTCNIGMALGTVWEFPHYQEPKRLAAIDVDDNDMINDVLAAMPRLGPIKTGKKGLTIFCLIDVNTNNQKFKRMEGGKPAAKPSIELLAFGSQTVLPPSIHPEGMTYHWSGKRILEIHPDEWPYADDAVLDEIAAL